MYLFHSNMHILNDMYTITYYILNAVVYFKNMCMYLIDLFYLNINIEIYQLTIKLF